MESVAVPSRDAHPRGSAAAAHSTVAAAVAAQSTSPEAALAQELCTVKQRIADVEQDIEEAKQSRKACAKGDQLWLRADDELKQLRDEKALLLKKEEQLRDEFKRKELALDRAGEPHAQ